MEKKITPLDVTQAFQRAVCLLDEYEKFAREHMVGDKVENMTTALAVKTLEYDERTAQAFEDWIKLRKILIEQNPVVIFKYNSN